MAQNKETKTPHDVELLEAEQFYDFTKNGYSRPARVRCARADGSKLDVYVKFFGGVERREFGLVAELICSLIASNRIQVCELIRERLS